MITLPSLMIIAAPSIKKAIEEMRQNTRRYAGVFAATTTLFMILTQLNYDVMPLEPKAKFIQGFISSSGGVLVPYSSNAGPVGFYVPGLILVVGWVMTCTLLTAYAFKKDKRILATTLVVIVSFNLIIAVHQTGWVGEIKPNAAAGQVINKLDDVELEDTILVYVDEGLRAYVPPEKRVIGFDARDYEIKTRNLKQYSIVVVDFPKINEKHRIWGDLTGCDTQYESMKYGVKEQIATCKKKT